MEMNKMNNNSILLLQGNQIRNNFACLFNWLDTKLIAYCKYNNISDF